MTWAIDQASLGTNQGAGGTSTTIDLTTTNTVAAGAWIFVGVCHFNGSFTLSAVTNTTGAAVTWTNVQLANNAGVRAALVKGDAASGLASGSIIRATFTGSTNERRICACSFIGGTGVTQNNTTNTGATAAWSVTPTLSGNGLVIGVSSIDTLATSTPDGDTTELFDFLHTGTSQTTMGYRLNGTGVGGTWTSAVAWSAAGGSFEDTAATPATTSRSFSAIPFMKR